MTCNCTDEMDAKLGAHNSRLCVTFSLPRDGSLSQTFPHIMTEKIEKRQRGSACLAIPTFCPFCGTRYAEPASEVAS